MKVHLSDSSRAGFLGAALLAIAAYAVFGFQHGFEEQVGWYVTLLPGALVAAAISDIIRKTIPGAARVAFWSPSRHTVSFPTLPRVRKSLFARLNPQSPSHWTVCRQRLPSRVTTELPVIRPGSMPGKDVSLALGLLPACRQGPAS
jgi:hypothetical protein